MHSARVFAVASTFAVLLACGKPEPPPPVGPDPKPPIEQVAVPSACDNLNPPPDAQFPAGFDYPQSPATINSWITPGGGHRVRFHAYCVFAGLNQSSSTTPTWRKWGTSTQAFPYQYNPWKPSLAAGEGGGGSRGRVHEANLSCVVKAGKLAPTGVSNRPYGAIE